MAANHTDRGDQRPTGYRMRLQAGNGGRGGIRTHGCLHIGGFQDRCNRPLCHPSGARTKVATEVDTLGGVWRQVIASEERAVQRRVANVPFPLRPPPLNPGSCADVATRLVAG